MSGQEYSYARYTYTTNGLKATEKDANGNLTTLEYDGFDRLLKLRYPSTTSGAGTSSTTDYEQFSYDAAGNRLTHRRRDAQVVNYSYDALNRVTLEDVPGGTTKDVYTGYDLLGKVLWKRFVSTGGSGVSYAYDKAGRLTSTTDWNGRTLIYQYNAASGRTQLTFPDGVIQYYLYNYDGSLEKTVTGNATVGYTQTVPGYNNLGRVTAYQLGNGTGTSLSYDGIGRLTGLTQNLSGTANDVSWTFTYNPASQIISLTDNNAAYNYKETAGSTNNRTYDGLNRDAGIAVLSGGYDSRGNLTYDGTRTFTYDVFNRLLTSTGGSANLTLEYDPEGRLSKYTAGSTLTTFLYDGVNLIAEYNSSGTMLKRYMHTLGTDQPWVQFSGSSVARVDAQYLYANWQGSIIATAHGDTGALVDLYKYGPYGEPKNSGNVTSFTGSRFSYTGQTVLPEAQLYHYKARVYDPIAGRFLQTDPIGSADDLNLYAYVGGDPVNGTDSSGMCNDFGKIDCPPPASKKTREEQEQFKGYVDTKVAPETNKALGAYVAVVTAPAGCVVAKVSCSSAAAISGLGSAADQARKGETIDPGKVAVDAVKGAGVTGSSETGGAIGGVWGKLGNIVGQAVGAAGAVKGQGGSDIEAGGAAVGAVVGALIPGKGDDAAATQAGRAVGRNIANEVANRSAKCAADKTNC